MNPQTWWYVTRASGLIAWALVATTVIGGLLLATRITDNRPTPAWILDLHRFLGGLGVTFTALHLLGLVADDYVDFGAADLLVPYATSWKPGAVALGIIALYLLVAVEGTSLLMRRLPRRLWHHVHLTSYALFWLATLHMLLAGTDATHPLLRLAATLTITLVVFLTLVRILSERRRPARPRPDRSSAGDLRARTPETRPPTRRHPMPPQHRRSNGNSTHGPLTDQSAHPGAARPRSTAGSRRPVLPE